MLPEYGIITNILMSGMIFGMVSVCRWHFFKPPVRFIHHSFSSPHIFQRTSDIVFLFYAMITPLSFQTAYNYWLQASSIPQERYSFADLNKFDDGFSAEALIRSARIFHIDPPIHVLVERPDQRHFSTLLCSHVLPGNLPAKSFVRLADHLFVVSPECCFLMAAHLKSLSELVCMANDLCATYRRDDLTALGQSSRMQLTTTAKLSEYLEHAANIKGLKQAKQAVRYAVDCSNSPMESKLAVMVCLPMVLGGFGLPKPYMNHVIGLPLGAATFLGHDSCCVDMLWEQQRVILEYDSNLTHLSRDQHHYDKKRATALSMAGYTVISVTADHLSSHSSINKLCLDLRKVLGIRTHINRFNQYNKIRYETVENIIYGRANVQKLRL